MPESSLTVAENFILQAPHLHYLLEVLQAQGFQTVGPSLDSGDLVYAGLNSIHDLPIGWTNQAQGGAFRLQPRGDQAFFGYNVGQQSWKQFLFPPRTPLWEARQEGKDFNITYPAALPSPYAFIGAHACDLQAIATLDKVFLQGQSADRTYQAGREPIFVVAVNCTQSAQTCFCTSMQTGPRARRGFDLALTEIISEHEHYFLVEVGTGRGAEIFRQVPHSPAPSEARNRARELLEQTAARMGRQLETADLQEMLYRNYDNPHWDKVAERCLTCGNCTAVCPTCFCHSIEESRDLTGQKVERWRRWDVCYTIDHSYIHGGSIRTSTKARYRQWLTHKLATWLDQFGCFGCVGCGRCIAWCPVAIDLREEVRALRANEK